MKHFFSWVIIAIGILSLPLTVLAAEQDLALTDEKLWFNKKTFTEEAKVRIYATVENRGNVDLKGVVRFFDGQSGPQLKGDQPISVIVGREDTVFIDIIFAVPGDHEITAKIFPFDAENEDSSNNTAKRTITVLRDYDRDEIPDSIDPDSDNDGVLNANDAFPLNEKESLDTDGDSVGNNADFDDDNDGIPDADDAFPLNSNESKDTDRDGVGDKKDAFPNNPAESSDYDKDGVGDNADKDADNDGIEKSKDINDKNKGPIIALDGIPLLATIDKPVYLDTSKTKDSDGTITAISLEISGKGQAIKTALTPAKPYPHTFTKTGEYKITLKAVDDKGESRTKDFYVKVRSPLFFMGLLAGILLLIILAIFAILTYASSARKSLLKNSRKLLKKKFSILKKVL